MCDKNVLGIINGIFISHSFRIIFTSALENQFSVAWFYGTLYLCLLFSSVIIFLWKKSVLLTTLRTPAKFPVTKILLGSLASSK